MNRRTALREMLNGVRIRQVPGIYDGLTARLAQAAGYEAIFVTGNGVAASLLGKPDLGLVTASESLAVARSLAAAVDIPIVFDADTGYGSALNVMRTVADLEAAGVAGITLEDQVTPKRCGVWSTPVAVVAEKEFLGKIEAAIHSRKDPEFVVIARTDAMGALGLVEAARRAAHAVEAGADAALVIGAREHRDLSYVRESVSGPLALLVEERGPVPSISLADLEDMGYRLAVYPGAVRYSVMAAVKSVLSELRTEGSTERVRHLMSTPEEWNDVLGLTELLENERCFVRGSGVATRSDAGQGMASSDAAHSAKND